VIRLLHFAAYVIAVFAIATGATWAASLLPITNPLTAWGVCVAAGCFATIGALTWLPCPCQRKDGR